MTIDLYKCKDEQILIIKKIELDDEPEINFKDEIMYALGNIIQNAIFYSRKFVTVELNYNNQKIN